MQQIKNLVAMGGPSGPNDFIEDLFEPGGSPMGVFYSQSSK